MLFHIIETKDQTYTIMALSLNERQNCLELHDWVPEIRKICANCGWTVSCVHSNNIKAVRRYRQTGSVKDRPRSGCPQTEPHLWRTDLIAERYINDVLQPVVVPFVNRHPNTIFRNDNARPHLFLEEHNIERMDPWPAHSPDMKPIKAIMGPTTV